MTKMIMVLIISTFVVPVLSHAEESSKASSLVGRQMKFTLNLKSSSDISIKTAEELALVNGQVILAKDYIQAKGDVFCWLDNKIEELRTNDQVNLNVITQTDLYLFFTDLNNKNISRLMCGVMRSDGLILYKKLHEYNIEALTSGLITLIPLQK